jgi:hypothetical protein
VATNRRSSEFPEIAGTTIDESDLLTLVHVFEVDPVLRNKKITFSGFKDYLNQYYTPSSGGVFNGNVIISGNLTVTGTTNVTTITGNTAGFTTATVTSGVFASGTAAAPSVSVGTTDNGLYSPGTDQVALATSGTGRLFISEYGGLLVGTSTALTGTFTRYSKLVVQGNTALSTGFAILSLARGQTAAEIASADQIIGRIDFSDSGPGQFATISCITDAAVGLNDYPSRLEFSVTADNASSPTTSPSAMTINNAQKVLIGYSSDNGAYKLQVNSQIFATSATIATSDGRYKENIATLDGCLDLVKALRPVSFTWKPQQTITQINDEGEETVVREPHNFPEGTQVGFIAQEVQEVLEGKPWLGSVIKENVRPAVLDGEGNRLAPEEQFYGIAEGNLIAVLTNALQEAVTEIESLKARLDAANL